MNVNKLSIGAFIPKKGFKIIHVKNPEHKTVETFLTLASRTQRQEALESALAAKAVNNIQAIHQKVTKELTE